MFHYHYDYTYNEHDHFVQAFDVTSIPWWTVPPFFEEPKIDVYVDIKVEGGKPVKEKKDVEVEVDVAPPATA